MKRKQDDRAKDQGRSFIEAAREAECDPDERVWEERLRKVAKAQPKAETKKPAK